MKCLIPVGRVIYSVPFILFGINHFVNAEGLSMMVPAFLPAPMFWAYLIGVAFIVSGVSILINQQTKWGGIILAAVLLGLIALIQIPSLISQGITGGSIVNPLKDISLFGSALVVIGLSQRKDKKS